MPSSRPSPQNSKKRVKLIALVALLSVATIWIGYQVVGMMGGHGTARILNTPGWNQARELTTKLNADLRFNDIGLAVVSESPLQLRAEGLVHGQKTLDELKAFLAAEAPDATIEYQVVVMP